MVSKMNGSPMTNVVPAASHRRPRRKRGIIPKGGRVALTPRERQMHAQLTADGRPKSGRSGAYVYYPLNGKQCWRRHAVPKDPHTPAQQRCRERFAAASKAYSENGLLTEAPRHESCADGARRNSRPLLGQSGPLTHQQDDIRRNAPRSSAPPHNALAPAPAGAGEGGERWIQAGVNNASVAVQDSYVTHVRLSR